MVTSRTVSCSHPFPNKHEMIYSHHNEQMGGGARNRRALSERMKKRMRPNWCWALGMGEGFCKHTALLHVCVCNGGVVVIC